MKAEIIGYVTGMINSYIRTIDQFKKDEVPVAKYKKFDLVKEELSDLLDFVQDIPEVTTTNTSPEINILNKRVAELEDSCENMNDIEKNLHLKIEELNNRNKLVESNFNVCGQKNMDLRLDNIAWQKACKELEEKNIYQEESLKTYEANRQAFSVLATKYKNLEGK